MKKANIEFAEDFYSEKVKVSINDLDILGKKNYLPRLKTIHKSLFKEVNFDNLHVHTNYFSPEALASDGKTMGEVNLNEKTIWTNVWGTVTGVGRTH